jgi:hypothetical protein
MFPPPASFNDKQQPTSVTSYSLESCEVEQPVKEARIRIAIIMTFRKSNKNPLILQQILKNVALFTRYTQCAGRTHYLLYGVLAQKLLASHCMHSLHTNFIHHDGGAHE